MHSKFKFKTSFAETTFNNKYRNGLDDTWPTLCRRLVNDVCGDRSMSLKPTTSPLMSKEDQEQLIQYMIEMKFIPGGRYLYYAGRAVSFFNNCFAFISEEDTREEWGRLLQRASDALMSGGGLGNDYSVFRPSGRILSKTGGISSGPLPLMCSVNEVGRNVMQGGSRRSALYASLNWQHEDIHMFMTAKDYSPEVKALKAANFNFPAQLDMTNISINWDTAFIESKKTPQLWYDSVRKMCESGEPGHSYNFYENEKETGRNAPVSGNTRVLTYSGYECVKNILGVPTTLWTGNQWAYNVVFKQTRESDRVVRISLSNGRDIVCSYDHPFITKEYKYNSIKSGIKYVNVDACDLTINTKIKSTVPQDYAPMKLETDAYGLGFVFGDGSIRNQKIDLSYFVDNKKVSFLTSVGALGLRINDSNTRAYGHCVYNNKTELLETNLIYNPSFIAGWFDADGCYTRQLLRLSHKDKDTLILLSEALDLLGIRSIVRLDGKSSYKPENPSYTLQILADSLLRFKKLIPTMRVVINDLDDEYKPYREKNIFVTNVEFLDYNEPVYCCDVGVEEHSFMAEGVVIANCTELTTEDDSDVCNLGSINFANITSLDELRDVVCLASKFLVCGSIRGDLPYDKVKEVREKNRRIGLGLMGVHEWLLQRGEKYEVTPELHTWLAIWKNESERAANEHSDRFFINRPKKYRAIAPAGTIGILASTTTGIEPLFAVAYKRRYLTGASKWKYQYVIDATAERLITELGIEPDSIETSSILAQDPVKRIKFQYDIQKYTDMAIASTLNLPSWGSDHNNDTTARQLADTLLEYCHGLRGITVYPDGGRGGQPLTSVSYQEAKGHGDVIYEEEENKCSNGICGL